MEVWANMDNAAYTNYVRGYATSTAEDPAVIMKKIAKCESNGQHYKKDGTLVKNIKRRERSTSENFRSIQHRKPKASDHYIPLPTSECGIADIIACAPNGQSWAIEVKTPKGRVTDEQWNFWGPCERKEVSGYLPVQ